MDNIFLKIYIFGNIILKYIYFLDNIEQTDNIFLKIIFFLDRDST